RGTAGRGGAGALRAAAGDRGRAARSTHGRPPAEVDAAQAPAAVDAAQAPAEVDAAGSNGGPSALDRAAEERALGAAEPPPYPDESPP
ncbi:hypothetical protein ABZY34_19195, partial [Streptomyces virginiae]